MVLTIENKYKIGFIIWWYPNVDEILEKRIVITMAALILGSDEGKKHLEIVFQKSCLENEWI